MFSVITNDVRISVIPEYDPKNSFPTENRFLFRYHITVENLGSRTIKLLRRKWMIYDVGFGFTDVRGEGVIGLTPEIQPGEHFKYFSNVVLRSGFGTMTGSYYCEELDTERRVELEIPKFNLVADLLIN